MVNLLKCDALSDFNVFEICCKTQHTELFSTQITVGRP